MRLMGDRADADKNLTLHTVGPLRLIDRNGCDRTPKRSKARGLLALLAFSPGHQRARIMLQDKLWSDRGPEQGAASLRQTLTEIRQSFGPWRHCLVCDRTMIGLDPGQVDVLTLANMAGLPATSGVVEMALFEGLEVRDREFEDWLRNQRTQFEDELEKRVRLGSATEVAAQVVVEKQPTRQRRLSIVLQIEEPPTSPSDAVVANTLIDIIGKIIAELSSVDILDSRGLPEPARVELASSLGAGTTAILVGAARNLGRKTWRLVISDPVGKRLIWSTAERQDGGRTFDVENPDVLRSLNRAVDIALMNSVSTAQSWDDRTVATQLSWEGIGRLMQLGKNNLAAADQLFERAFELDARGIYLAWRAYLRTYLLAERLCASRETTVEEALALLRRAIELEPHNSYVASFGAQVHTIVRRSYIAAYELAHRSIEINPANPMGWACLGIAECHLGRSTAGLRHALTGRRIAGSSRLRFQVDALSCIAATMAGDVETAIQCAESSHALAPAFAPPLRYLSALYLLRGEHEKSLEQVKTLQAFEPDFSYAMLRDKSYPTAGLQRSKLLEILPARQI